MLSLEIGTLYCVSSCESVLDLRCCTPYYIKPRIWYDEIALHLRFCIFNYVGAKGNCIQKHRKGFHENPWSHDALHPMRMSVLIMFRKGLSQPWLCIRSMIDFLGTISDSTLGSKQVIPHPSKHKLYICHEIMPHPSKLCFETWIVHRISMRIQWTCSSIQVVIIIRTGTRCIQFVMTARIQ